MNGRLRATALGTGYTKTTRAAPRPTMTSVPTLVAPITTIPCKRILA